MVFTKSIGIFEPSNTMPQQMQVQQPQQATQQHLNQSNQATKANQFKQQVSATSQSEAMASIKQQQQQRQHQLQQQSSLDQMLYNQNLSNMPMNNQIVQQDGTVLNQQGFIDLNTANMYANSMLNQSAMGINTLNNNILNQNDATLQQGLDNPLNAYSGVNSWNTPQEQIGMSNQGPNQLQMLKQMQQPGQLGLNSQSQFGFNQQQQQQPRFALEQYNQYSGLNFDPNRTNDTTSMPLINESTNIYSGLMAQEQANNLSMSRSMPLYNMSSQFSSVSPASNAVRPSQSQTSLIGTTITSNCNMALAPTQIGRVQNVIASQTTSQASLPVVANVISARTQQSQQASVNKAIQQQYSDSSWAHATELSPILDVSPSVEAAEAQEIIDRRRGLVRK